MIFKLLLDLILLGFITGLIIWPIAEIVTDKSGPFDIFNRLRIALIPEFLRPVCLLFDPDEMNDFSQHENTLAYMDFFKAYEGELHFVETYLEYDDKFNASLRGTLFNILNCKFCFGVWTTMLISQAVVSLFYGFNGAGVLLAVFVWPIGVTSQRAIIHYFNRRR